LTFTVLILTTDGLASLANPEKDPGMAATVEVVWASEVEMG
jgi:hypothetical protein